MHIETQPDMGVAFSTARTDQPTEKRAPGGGRAQSAAPPPGAVGGLAVEDTHVPSETD